MAYRGKKENTMKVLYEFYEDFGRDGSLNGVFVAEDYEVEKLYGNEVYFGEILGKHSEIFCNITKENLKEIDDVDDLFVNTFDMYFPTGIGYNPLLRWKEDQRG